jgi:hypothetical protein
MNWPCSLSKRIDQNYLFLLLFLRNKYLSFSLPILKYKFGEAGVGTLFTK